MSQIIYPINHLPPVIDIGKQTEKGVTRIGFDMHEWMDDWPGMKFSVQPTRPGEKESKLADTEMVGSVIFWLVGAVDTEKPGSGTVEVLGVTEDERKLSFMCRTSIANTNTATTAEIPEPNQPWVDRVIIAGETAKEKAKEAAESAVNASHSEQAAGQYSANADIQAKAAASSARAAAESEAEALKAKDKAITQADDAEESAKNAQAWAGRAETHAANAATSETNAATSAGAAATSANAASDSAAKADESERAAGQYANTASYQAQEAARYVTSAAQSASSAAASAQAADASATDAAASAKAAAASEKSAGQYSANADEKAKAADTSAQEAARSASNAASSAEAAAKSAAAIPGASDPLKHLVTDEDGKVTWEDRLAYKISRMERIVYLPEGAWTYTDDGEYAVGMSDWAKAIQDGVEYVVQVDDTPYVCTANKDGSIIILGGAGYPFELIYNPPSLPLFFPTDGSKPSDVTVYREEEVEYKKTIDPQLLPVQGIGGFVVTATVTSTNEDGKSGACIFDKTFADTLAAVKAGRYVICHFVYDGVTNIMQVVMVGELSEVAFAQPIYPRCLVVAMLPDGTGAFQITTV